MDEVERIVRQDLKLVLTQFLGVDESQRKGIALVLDSLCSSWQEISSLSDDLKEVLEKFLAFHHWGDEDFSPGIGFEEIQAILDGLN